MKSGTSISTWIFPFISRKKHEALVNHLHKTIDKFDMEVVRLDGEIIELEMELKKLKRTRNAKGQFERRAK